MIYFALALTARPVVAQNIKGMKSEEEGGISRFYDSLYIFGRVLESNCAKFGLDRSKGLKVYREQTARHSILYI